MARIAEAVNALRAAHDYLFTTGGIGPTHDDITVDAIAAALGVPVIVHPKARGARSLLCDRPGGLTEARLRMARVPEGAELIANPMSGAPGIRIGNIFILAGVPHIARHARGADRQARRRAADGFGDDRRRAPESEVADLLRETEAAHPGCRSAATPSSRTGARRELRDPLGGRRPRARDGSRSFRAPARRGLRAGKRRDLA